MKKSTERTRVRDEISGRRPCRGYERETAKTGGERSGQAGRSPTHSALRCAEIATFRDGRVPLASSGASEPTRPALCLLHGESEHNSLSGRLDERHALQQCYVGNYLNVRLI